MITRRFDKKRNQLFGIAIVFTLIGLIVRLSMAILVPSTERPDEIYQNLEPAYRLWTGNGVITWEWRSGIRSWLFPGTLTIIMRLTEVLHLSQDYAVPLIWGVLSIVSCSVIVSGVWMGWTRFGAAGSIISGLLTTFWPDLVYYGPKTLVEVQSGHTLLIAAVLSSGLNQFKPLRQLLIGILLGLTFALRFQLAFSILLIFCWNLGGPSRRAWAPLVLGVAIPILFLGIVDWWSLGTAMQSVWKNIQVNLFEGKASEYGTTPVYGYVNFLVSRNGAAFVPLFLLFIYGFRTAPLLALTSLSVLGIHSLISHKEISFVYAALPCAIIVVSLGASRLLHALPDKLQKPLSERSLLIFGGILCLLVTGSLAMSERPFAMSTRATAIQNIVNIVRSKRDLCGFALAGFGSIPWSEAGGYVSLRRKVPIYLLNSVESLAKSKGSFNYVIGPRSIASIMTGFRIDICTHEYCLYRQEVLCEPDLDHEISEELARKGQ